MKTFFISAQFIFILVYPDLDYSINISSNKDFLKKFNFIMI